MENQVLRDRFESHKLSNVQVDYMTHIRENAISLTSYINCVVEDGREKSLAITKIEEAVMWAIKGIALKK